jgi:putative tricarboxylic transport membrane protein
LSQRIRHVLPHFVLLLVSIGLYALAANIDSPGSQSGDRIGPDFWPKAVIGFMGLLCAFEIARRLVFDARPAHRRGFTAAGLPVGLDRPPGEAPDAAAEPEPSDEEHPKVLWAGGALIVAYVVAVAWAGFFVSTAVFLAGFAWIGGFRRPLANAAIGVVGSLVLVVIFMRVAYISLPLGAGPFRSLSLALLELLGVR